MVYKKWKLTKLVFFNIGKNQICHKIRHLQILQFQTKEWRWVAFLCSPLQFVSWSSSLVPCTCYLKHHLSVANMKVCPMTLCSNGFIYIKNSQSHTCWHLYCLSHKWKQLSVLPFLRLKVERPSFSFIVKGTVPLWSILQKLRILCAHVGAAPFAILVTMKFGILGVLMSASHNEVTSLWFWSELGLIIMAQSVVGVKSSE